MTSLGQSLREEREARNISLEEIASATKIVPRYLEALETDRLDLMPGGFFVRGIIRSYARAVGLDPEAVLERYRAAGLLGGPESGRKASPRPVGPSGPQAEPPRLIAPPAPPKEAPAEAGPAPAEAERAAPPILFADISEPKPSPDARRRALAWTWRGLALVVVGGAALVLWSPWRHRPATPQTQTVATRSELPQARKSEPSPAPAATVQTPDEKRAEAVGQTVEPGARPAGEPAAPKPEAAPAADDWKGVTIEIVFEAETWIQVYTDGKLQVGGLFPAGATARAQASEKLLIHTGNAGGFTFRLNGRPAKPLGRSGQVLTDIKITPENLKDFLEAPSPGPAAD